MKLALDVWYELWERTTASEDGTAPNRHPEEEAYSYHGPWREDYLTWVRAKEARDDGR
jgi:hypothetical protein